MILFSLGLLGFATVDLIRWSPEAVAARRSAIAAAGGTAAAVAVAALSDLSLLQILIVAAAAPIAYGAWAAFDHYAYFEDRPGWPLAWIGGLMTALFAMSGSVGPIAGPLGRWYANLGFGFVESISVGQFVLALAAGLFLTASTNRIVRLVLDAAVDEWETGEEALRGGRILGPLERLLIAAIVLAGDLAAGAIVITAKGLLRFPEIRGDDGDASGQGSGRGPDANTEYFLIGTFASLVVAVALAVTVLASA